jgi:hypothetical protein
MFGFGKALTSITIAVIGSALLWWNTSEDHSHDRSAPVAEAIPEDGQNSGGCTNTYGAIGEPGLQAESRRRMFLIKPHGYVNIGSYSVPGYYTLIMFSAPWCAPCTLVRKQAMVWLEKYPNLMVVDLDIGTLGDVDPKSSSILADLGRSVALPAALFINPFGVYINTGKGPGVAPPVSGAEAIFRALCAFDKRGHKEVISFPLDTIKRLKELKALQDMNSRPSHPHKNVDSIQ